ncbi:cupredoxin domain-containing protein [Sphingomonas donggukensis]|uniref:Cupredoxin domain-containing protein n=1 Tax=Sphingomonas donggukensis TaxID=2949093 RepID=A0ABY4TY30_9SPHN|nr:cupredoxin domain-containing protein [Sphingomonas donggukensis]URW75208.1 cupredoxin domain-containing protein [Sphingomonas donggukensis]
MRMILAISALMLAAPAAAQGDAVERVDITLSSFKFEPKSIHLQHGRPYLLHFTNSASGGHNFVAKAFFAAAKASGVADGRVELERHASADVRIVAPAAGRYPVKCSHFLHSTFGMTGEIVVE